MKAQTFYETNQKIFDKVWQHFIVENNPRAYNPETDKCTYYSESGGCAIGCLIEDDNVKKDLDSAYASSIQSVRRICAEIFDKIIYNRIDSNFLGDLQYAHDNHSLNINYSLIDLALYYSESGGCAIGCLISDDKDKRKLDTCVYAAIWAVRQDFPNIISKYINDSIETKFLSKLQTIHDNFFYLFELKMRSLATEYNLKVPKAAKTK